MKILLTAPEKAYRNVSSRCRFVFFSFSRRRPKPRPSAARSFEAISESNGIRFFFFRFRVFSLSLSLSLSVSPYSFHSSGLNWVNRRGHLEPGEISIFRTEKKVSARRRKKKHKGNDVCTSKSMWPCSRLIPLTLDDYAGERRGGEDSERGGVLFYFSQFSQ